MTMNTRSLPAPAPAPAPPPSGGVNGPYWGGGAVSLPTTRNAYLNNVQRFQQEPQPRIRLIVKAPWYPSFCLQSSVASSSYGNMNPTTIAQWLLYLMVRNGHEEWFHFPGTTENTPGMDVWFGPRESVRILMGNVDSDAERDLYPQYFVGVWTGPNRRVWNPDNLVCFLPPNQIVELIVSRSPHFEHGNFVAPQRGVLRLRPSRHYKRAADASEDNKNHDKKRRRPSPNNIETTTTTTVEKHHDREQEAVVSEALIEFASSNHNGSTDEQQQQQQSSSKWAARRKKKKQTIPKETEKETKASDNDDGEEENSRQGGGRCRVM